MHLKNGVLSTLNIGVLLYIECKVISLDIYSNYGVIYQIKEMTNYQYFELCHSSFIKK